MHSTVHTISNRDRWIGLAATYTCVTGISIAMGLSIPLLPLMMQHDGYSPGFIGANATIGSAALLVTAPLVPAMANRIGSAGLLIISFVLLATITAAYPLMPVWTWFPLRFIMNVAFQGLFVVSEVWINTLATEKVRGRLIALYGALATAGFAAGPALASRFPDNSPMPFYLGAAIVSLGIIPISLARRTTPRIEHVSLRGIFAVLGLAAVPLFAVLAHAGAETATSSFLSVFAVDNGWLQNDAILLMTVFGLGNVLLQLPIGFLADHFDRRIVLAGCAVVGCAGGLLLPVASHSPVELAVIAFIWGGSLVGLYTVGLTMIGQMFKGHDLPPASSAFAMVYAFGAIFGPGGAGFTMDHLGPSGLGWYVAAVCGLYAILAIAFFRRSRLTSKHS